MLGTAIGHILAPAVGVAISPAALIAIIALLTGPRARTNGVVFVVTWILALAIEVAILLLAAGWAGASHGEQPGPWVGWVKIVIGLAALTMAATQVRHAIRPAAEPHPIGEPTASPTGTASLAATLALANPKNLTQVATAAVIIASVTPGHGSRVIAAVVFLAVASLCVTLPMAVYLLAGQHARERLTRWRDWANTSATAMMAVLLTVLGTASIGGGIATLTS
ncbi:GAP family protein [Nocardia sp. NPDC051832]|uniref:GAP family protein n=1 Tax=Nocardia sp. NPDC051832 TaxID=3155673 RepID=UPI003442DAC3